MFPKRNALLLWFILSTSGCMIVGLPIPANNYYTATNLQALKKKGIRLHAPCRIIIDNDPVETPDSYDIQALTFGFAASLRVEFFPIIVSRSIVYNYLYRSMHHDDPQHPENSDLALGHIALKSRYWHAYQVDKSDFILLVPEKFLSLYGSETGLALETLTNITTILDNPEELLKLLSTQETEVTDIKTQLQTIFKNKRAGNSPLWDIQLEGHGEIKTLIAGLPIDDLQSLLAFFNTQVDVNVLYVSSCYAGGININFITSRLMQTLAGKEYETLETLNYLLIVGSISDTPTWSENDMETFFYDFFDHAARLNQPATPEEEAYYKEKSRIALEKKETGEKDMPLAGKTFNRLGQLLRAINLMEIKSGDPSGTANIPQILLPGDTRFRTFNIDERVMVLGNVLVQAHTVERKPIIINNKVKAVLIYPKIIPPAIRLAAPLLGMPDSITLLPTAVELARDNEDDELWIQFDTSFPAYNSLHEISYKRFIYPEFISMIPGTAAHLFKNIEVISSPNEPLVGIFHFISNAFLQVSQAQSNKAFFIDNLSGRNDLTLLLEGVRIQSKEIGQHPLERELNLADQITLKNVSITRISEKNGNWTIVINFEFNQTAWKLWITRTMVWDKRNLGNFKQIELEKYRNHYKRWIKNLFY